MYIQYLYIHSQQYESYNRFTQPVLSLNGLIGILIIMAQPTINQEVPPSNNQSTTGLVSSENGANSCPLKN